MEAVILETSIINIAVELQNSLFFASVFILSFEAVIGPSLLSLPMQHVVFEKPTKRNVTSVVSALSISTPKSHLTFIIVSIDVYEPAEAVRQTICKSSLVITSIWIIVLAVAMRLAVQPFSFIHNSSSTKSIK